jgi:hypothetical protein
VEFQEKYRMSKDLHIKLGLWLLGSLLIIVAVAFAQTGTSSYLPMVFGPDIFFAGPGESEPNNSFSEANGPLRPDFIYNGLATDPDDFYFFEAGGSGTITVDVLDLIVGEAQISIYREVEGAPPELVESANSPPDFHLELSRPPGGKYYVVVHVGPAALQRSTIPYTLNVSYPLPPTPTPVQEPTDQPTAGPSPTPTEKPTRSDGPTSTPTVSGSTTPEPTIEATPTVSGTLPAIQNASLESGPVVWEESSSGGFDIIIPASTTSFPARTGQWLARQGGEVSEISRLGQWIDVPNDIGTFYLNHYMILQSSETNCDPDVPADSIEIHVNSEIVSRHPLCAGSNTSTWRPRNWTDADLSQYAGQTIFLEIVIINDGVADTISSVYIDDVFFSH